MNYDLWPCGWLASTFQGSDTHKQQHLLSLELSPLQIFEHFHNRMTAASQNTTQFWAFSPSHILPPLVKSPVPQEDLQAKVSPTESDWLPVVMCFWVAPLVAAALSVHRALSLIYCCLGSGFHTVHPGPQTNLLAETETCYTYIHYGRYLAKEADLCITNECTADPTSCINVICLCYDWSQFWLEEKRHMWSQYIMILYSANFGYIKFLLNWLMVTKSYNKFSIFKTAEMLACLNFTHSVGGLYFLGDSH